MTSGESKKVLFATGAARGLGRCVVERFLADDFNVLAYDSNAKNLNLAREEWPADGRVISRVGDVRQQEEVQDAVDAAVSHWGRIDVLANVAGIAMECDFLDIGLEDWRQIIDVNLTGSFIVAQTVARQMTRQAWGGVIVNMSSKNGIAAEVRYAHYNASKAGIILLTKTMALELAERNIRVNAVAPGYCVTPLSQEMDPPEFVAFYRDRLVPLGRLGTPEDVAGAFAFLASDDASWITGHTLVVDGGQISSDGRTLRAYPG